MDDLTDTHTETRQAWIKSLPHPTAWEIKVARVKAAMGTKYLCHPANRVKRIAHGPATSGDR